MTQLRRLARHYPGEIEDMLVAERVEPSSPLAELPVEEGIVIRLPTDLGDVELAR